MIDRRGPEQEVARQMAVDQIRQFPERLLIIEECWQRLSVAKIKDLDRHPDRYPEIAKMRTAIEQARAAFTASSGELLLSEQGDSLAKAREAWKKIETVLTVIADFYSAFIKDRPVKIRRDAFTLRLTNKINELSEAWSMLEPLLKFS